MESVFDIIVWEWSDLLKAVLSLFAGFVLGFEREWKDKSAGFKTISIICLGSTLFSLLSMKAGVGESEDATRIASYVVSGIGFLGAGVIFKDGVTVNGLTTASIIWMSAAIGMAIGFGIFITAAIFLAACFIIIISGPLINKYIIHNIVKVASIRMAREDFNLKRQVISELEPIVKHVRVKKQMLTGDSYTLDIEVLIDKRRIREFEAVLIARPEFIQVTL
ncbi:MAG: MgtC/SapB family protein [Sphingobacterium sp.]